MGRDTTTGSPPMIGRRLTIQEWLDYLAGYDFGSIPPDRLVLHHTWSPTEEQWAGLRSMQGMQTYYHGKGWPAAPHLYVAEDGIWLFTPMYDVGVHANTGNANLEFQSDWGNASKLKWYSLGIEMVGDFDGKRPSGQTWENVKAVLGGLVRRLGLNVERDIHFHREFNTGKSCPGHAVTYDWVHSEVNAWLSGTQPTPQPDVEDFVVDSPGGVEVYQGPGDQFKVAGKMKDDEPFQGVYKEDADCFWFEGRKAWVWVATGLGFVPATRARHPNEPRIHTEPAGLTIVAEPRISRVQFTRVLASIPSPALFWTCDLYDICVQEGVDPAVALAFFYHESKLGTLGLTATYDLKNWGNVRSPEDASLGEAVPIPNRGNFCKYPSWTNGLLDWCKRLKGPKYAGSGLSTVETVVPKYAPTGDGNSPTTYINAVKTLVARWQEEDK